MHIIEVNDDYINKITSGKFKIIYINEPEKIELVYNLIARNQETFFIIITIDMIDDKVEII